MCSTGDSRRVSGAVANPGPSHRFAFGSNVPMCSGASYYAEQNGQYGMTCGSTFPYDAA